MMENDRVPTSNREAAIRARLATGVPPRTAGERADDILARVRREVTVRDLLTFAVGRIWLVLLVITSWLYAHCHGRIGRRDERTSATAH
jgi:hypothetical protein